MSHEEEPKDEVSVDAELDLTPFELLSAARAHIDYVLFQSTRERLAHLERAQMLLKLGTEVLKKAG
jgi:hypothetical protein